MAAIHLEKPHHLGRDEAIKRMHQMEPELAQKYGVKLDWMDGQASVRASSLSGKISVGDDLVAIHLDLGLKLRLLMGKIRSALDAQVTRALA
jgi:putative polyhydroxyalkanoate system protein